MRKHLNILFLTALATSAQAHSLWVVTQPAKAGEPLKADLAYSHNFPHAEAIAEDRLHIFKPLALYSESGNSDMKLYNSNFQYESAEPLKAGAYWVGATYQPTFWSKNANGWKQQNRSDMPDASYCELAVMYGKMYTATAGTQSEFYKKPLGFAVEIIPLADPASVKLGEPFPLQVLIDGKPAAGVTVTGSSDTFVVKDMEAEHDHREPQAFSGKTDKEGKVNLIPLISGFWKISTEYTSPYKDLKICDENVTKSSLSMLIGDDAKIPNPEQGHSHEHKH